MSGWRWREPVLAVAGIALAVGSAGLGMLIANALGGEEQITAYSAEPSEPPPAADETPQPEPTATPEAAATHEATPTQLATATRSATATRTATATPRATSTPTPRPSATPVPTRTPTAAPTATRTPTPSAASLEQTSFVLPGDGTPNGGGTIGPFCCQGRTVTLRTTGGTIVGYAYWYKWAGQAYTFSNGDAIPDIRVLFYDVNAGEAVIALSAGEVSAGVSRGIEIGSLQFTVTFTSASHTSYGGATYLWESSLGATLQVSLR